LVTVLTPATTFTVGEDFNQKIGRVNSSDRLLAKGHKNKDQPRGLVFIMSFSGGADGTRTRDLRRDRPAF
jgi:hypothetical protein